jgi:hypothetical protein
MKNKKFVAFLDILGFSELVKNNSHDYLVKEFKKFLFINQYNLARGRINNNAKDQDEIFNTDISRVNLISISDSIILYTNDDSIYDFIHIIDATSTLLNTSIQNGFPLRGGLTYGNLSSILKNNQSSTLDYQNYNHILVGKALVKAYELEKIQEWSGCVISDECLNKYEKKEDFAIIKYLKLNYKIIEYVVPIKNGNKKAYVINWVNEKINKIDVKKAFQKHNKSINEKVEIKISNTLKFYDYIYDNKYFNQPRIFLEKD